MGVYVDNTLKVLLGVLGFAGILTALATTLNIPSAQETPAPAVATPAPPPPAANMPDPLPEEEEVIDEDDVTDEDLASFGKPTMELPGDEEEEQAIADANVEYNGPVPENDGPPPPPPPGAM
jgi:hypothetical protein